MLERQKIPVVSGHEYYLIYKNKTNKTTTNWNCSKHETNECRATAITDEENFVETRGEHDYDFFTGKSDARLILKNIKDLSDRPYQLKKLYNSVQTTAFAI